MQLLVNYLDANSFPQSLAFSTLFKNSFNSSISPNIACIASITLKIMNKQVAIGNVSSLLPY